VLTASFFDLVTDMGGDRFLIQAKDGNDPSVQALVQFAQLTRGIVVAVVLAALAWPLSTLLKAPELFGALAALAIPTLIGGFIHMDMRRFQRRHDFRAEGISLLVAEPLSVLATITVAIVLHSFSAIVYGLVARSLVILIVSHLRSERPYSVAIERKHLGELTKFAGPLMVNGLLLFMGSQSDRVIVGGQLSLRELGIYSAIMLLIYYPSTMVQRYMSAMYLPLVTAHRAASARRESVELLGGQSILLALLMSVGFAIATPVFVPILYGAKFAQPAFTLALIGVLQSSRFLLVLWPSTLALGGGRSAVVLATNVVRLVAFPMAIVGAHIGGGLNAVVSAFALGEWAALGVGLFMTRSLSGGRLRDSLGRLCSFIFASMLIGSWPLALAQHGWAADVALACASLIIAWWILYRERAAILNVIDLLRAVVLRSPGAAGSVGQKAL
jgi:O-antigen/teichoic acid export membrane protein